MNNEEAKFTGKAVISKLHQLMSAIPYIQKDSENKEQKYKYLSYEAALEKIQPALIDLKMVSVPEFTTVEEREYSTAKGALWKYIRTRLKLQVIDVETGEYITAVGEGSGVDPGDKAVAKAQTMAMKNLWTKLLNIPVGTDPEADPATDRQQFAPKPTFGFQAYEPQILTCWQAAGWDMNQIPSYIQQRYGKPSAQLTAEECYAILQEFSSYAQQKTGGNHYE